MAECYWILKSAHSPKTESRALFSLLTSMFLITSGSTRGHKDEQGRWHFHDDTVSFFGKRHHRHKYPVGHKTHSLRTISGVPLVTLLSPAHESDQAFILPLVEELLGRYPELQFSYLILDRGYDASKFIKTFMNTLALSRLLSERRWCIQRVLLKMDQLYPWGFAMKPRGIEYKQQRTKYACFRVCKKYQQPLLFEAVTRKRSRRCSNPPTAYSPASVRRRRHAPACEARAEARPKSGTHPRRAQGACIPGQDREATRSHAPSAMS